MAFAQQQRRPRYNKYIPSSSSEEYSDYLHQQGIINRNNNTSDSETDWHVISSTSHSSNITSPVFSSESSIRLISDISEDESVEQAQTFLPSHDGTGTFINEHLNTTTEFDDAREFASAVNKLKSPFITATDDESEEGPSSIIDFTLPFRPPSFIPINVEPPSFMPTTAGINSQELTNGVLSAENQLDHSATKVHHTFQYLLKDNSSSTNDNNDDGKGGIPAALLSIIWNNLKKLRDHLIENDTNTAETLSNLMSEAVFEGCIPFSSHLHMEFDNTLHSSTTSYSFFEGNIAI